MMPLVSILIPTYNRKDYVVDAIRSAQTQTYAGPIEIVILDDRSTDGTATAIAPYLDDPRVRYVSHSQNLGIAKNWRAGIELARGDFLSFLHDDDTYEPRFVERLIEPLLNDAELIIAFCDHWVMSDRGRRLVDASDVASRQFNRSTLAKGVLPDFAAAALVDFSVPIGATLLRRASVRPEMIDPAAKGAIDCWLLYQCIRTGGKAFYLPERLMNYRLHGGSMSAGMPMHTAPGHLHRLAVLVTDPLVEHLRPAFTSQLSVARENIAFALIAAGRPNEARLELSMATSEPRRSVRFRFAVVAAHAGGIGRVTVIGVRQFKKFATRLRTRFKSDAAMLNDTTQDMSP